MSPPRSVLIVGAGLAGARCAETLRTEGFSGSIVLVGEESIAPYERPALSKGFLAGERRADELLLRPPSFWNEYEIDLELGKRIVFLDLRHRTARTSCGHEHSWDALVLATGARPRLPFAAPPGVHVLRTVADALRLRKGLVPGARLVIVGGGFVGTEVASSARQLGVEVTLVEAGPTPFAATLGAEVGRLLADRYRAHGVELLTRTGATGFRTGTDGRVRAVVLTDGHELRCHAVLVAVGAKPARELLRAEAPARVYACGDAAGGPGHWTSAAADAVNVGRRLLGLVELPAQPPFFWSDQFGLRLQLVGSPDRGAEIDLDRTDDGFIVRYRNPDGKLTAALAANQPAEVGRLRRELALAA